MRRSVLSAVLAAALSLVACSDQPTEPRPPDRAPTLSEVPLGCTPAPTAASLLAQIDQLYPSGPLRNSAQSQFKSIPSKITKATGAAARDKLFALIDFTLKNYYAGNLNDGTSTETFDKVLRLIEALHCYVGLTPPEFPSTTSGSDVVVGVVFQNSPTTTFSVPSGHAAVTIPTGAAPAATTIVIQRLPNSPPPLRTSLDQYRPFYHFSGTTPTGPVTFNLDVTAGICLEENRPGLVFDNLRLAHNVGPNFGDVEILPRPAGVVPGLTCPELGAEGELGLLSAAGSRESGPFAWAERLLLPAELHAASNAVIELGVGGTTKKFSEFGIVDPGSNPADLDFNGEFGELSAPAGTAVTPAPSVVVTSMNGTPIANVPVLFAVTAGGGTVTGGGTVNGSSATVATNDQGIATLTSWTLGTSPGTNTLTATPPAVAQIGSEAAPPYHPAAAFLPLSLTFTATVPSELGVTPVSSSVQLIASSEAGGVLVEDTDGASQGATLNPLTAAVNAVAENGEMSVLTEGSIAATWQSAEAGQVVFTDFGWTITEAENSHAVLFNGTDWTYTFTANQSGTFSLDYDVTVDERTTDEFGLQGITFLWAEGAGELQLERFFCVDPSDTFNDCEPTTTDTVTKSVVAGTTYTVRLQNAANLHGAFSSTAYMDATFDWSVTPAPIILLRQSVRSPSGVVAPLATTQLQCKGTQRRVCTRTYQSRQPAAAP